MKKLLTAIAAALLLLPVAAPQVQGFTPLCNTGNSEFRHIFVPDIPGVYFNSARATATIRNTARCEPVAGNQGASWVLPVNLEGPNGQILQLGFGWSDWSSMDFVYAVGTPTSAPYMTRWPGSWTPILGRTYRFTIDRVLNGGSWDTKFSIRDLTTGSTQSFTHSTWYGDYSSFWTGYEVWDYGDGFGVVAGDSPHRINTLERRTGGSSTWVAVSFSGHPILGTGPDWVAPCQYLRNKSCGKIESGNFNAYVY